MKIKIRPCKHKWLNDWFGDFVAAARMSGFNTKTYYGTYNNKQKIGWYFEEFENHINKPGFLQYGCYQCLNWKITDFDGHDNSFWPREYEIAKRRYLINSRVGFNWDH